MTNAQEYINQLTNKSAITHLDLSKKELTGTMDLKEFVNLESLNAYQNKFAHFNFLFTLPNKSKLKKVNLFGNEIEDIDLSFARLFREFPNLEQINLGDNPLSGDSFNGLNPQELKILEERITKEQVKLGIWRGSLLKYAVRAMRVSEEVIEEKEEKIEELTQKVYEKDQAIAKLKEQIERLQTNQELVAQVLVEKGLK